MYCWCYSDNQLSSTGPMNGTSIQCKSPEPNNPHADRSMRKDSDWSAPEQDSHVIHPSAILRNYHTYIHTNIFQTVNAWPLRWSRQRRIQTRATAGSIMSASRDLSKHIFYIPTPARSEKKKGITEEEESVNRMQLNGDFKLLSVGSWACYSRKRPQLGRIRKAAGRKEQTICCQREWWEMCMRHPQELHGKQESWFQ